jgi:RNA polymerase sigma factor (sigma-70 family)
LFRHARAILGGEDDALDATQAGLLLIARRLATLREPRWFRAWAYRIVTREAVSLAKRRGRERALFDDDADADSFDAPSPEPEEAADLIAQCTDAIDRLPAASGVVARLHYQEDLTLIEIAEALEIPVGTVKSRLSYALARLRETVTPC